MHHNNKRRTFAMALQNEVLYLKQAAQDAVLELMSEQPLAERIQNIKQRLRLARLGERLSLFDPETAVTIQKLLETPFGLSEAAGELKHALHDTIQAIFELQPSTQACR
jgi:hypothetical protein